MKCLESGEMMKCFESVDRFVAIKRNEERTLQFWDLVTANAKKEECLLPTPDSEDMTEWDFPLEYLERYWERVSDDLGL